MTQRHFTEYFSKQNCCAEHFCMHGIVVRGHKNKMKCLFFFIWLTLNWPTLGDVSRLYIFWQIIRLLGARNLSKKVWPWKVTINRSNGGHTKLKKKYLKNKLVPLLYKRYGKVMLLPLFRDYQLLCIQLLCGIYQTGLKLTNKRSGSKTMQCLLTF